MIVQHMKTLIKSVKSQKNVLKVYNDRYKIDFSQCVTKLSFENKEYIEYLHKFKGGNKRKQTLKVWNKSINKYGHTVELWDEEHT